MSPNRLRGKQNAADVCYGILFSLNKDGGFSTTRMDLEDMLGEIIQAPKDKHRMTALKGVLSMERGGCRG